MNLAIPSAGLDEVRRVWAGKATLWGAAAAVTDGEGRNWPPALARRRAARVVAEHLRPSVQAWPSGTRAWLDALPAVSRRDWVETDAPTNSTSWADTRRRGWPPRTFIGRRRSRIADSVLVTTTRWTIEALADVAAEAERVLPGVLAGVADRVAVASELLGSAPMAHAEPVVPTRADLAALRSSGRPWGSVAAVAALLRHLDHDPSGLATELLDPDPELADRLFHVAVLGLILLELRRSGCQLIGTALPGSADAKPVFAITTPAGVTWDLWFEAAGAWGHYGLIEPFPAAVLGIEGTGGPLGADVALIRPGEAVLFECKFSANPTYVGRSGYEQLLAYMAEARSGIADSCVGVLVGPDELVAASGFVSTSVGDLHVVGAGGIGAVLAQTPLFSRGRSAGIVT